VEERGVLLLEAAVARQRVEFAEHVDRPDGGERGRIDRAARTPRPRDLAGAMAARALRVWLRRALPARQREERRGRVLVAAPHLARRLIGFAAAKAAGLLEPELAVPADLCRRHQFPTS